MYGEHRARFMRKFLLDKEATPIERSCPYNPRSNDVIICGYFRSGTCWLQQILHQIRFGGGDESYTDVDEIVPYIPPYMERLDFELNSDQRNGLMGDLRLFKCHDCYEDAPMAIREGPGPKYIVLVRDPTDVAWSESRSRYRNLGVDKDYDYACVTELDSYSSHQHDSIARPVNYPTYWEHFLSWWGNKDKSNVLWIHYEDLQKDLRLCIVELARFVGVHLNDSQVDAVYEYSTTKYMQENAHKFAGEFLIRIQARMLAVTPWRPLIGRVSRQYDGARCGQGVLNLNERTKASLRWNWRHSIEKLTGYKNYAHLYTENSLLNRIGDRIRDRSASFGRQRRDTQTLNLL